MSNYKKTNSQYRKSTPTNSGNAMSHSGNSDVDIKVDTDTSSLAYAMLCLSHASGQISDDEFTRAVTNFNRLIGKENEQLPNILSNKESILCNNKPPHNRRCMRWI